MIKISINYSRILVVFIVLSLAVMPLAGLAAQKATVEERQTAIMDMRAKTLMRVFNDLDDSQEILEQAQGYAIFTNKGMNLLMLSTARGVGILRDHRDGSDTFMKVFGVGGGMGAGLKNYIVIMVFQTEAALDDFRTKGWELSGQAEANVDYEKASIETGREVTGTVGPGVLVYQMTDSGFALQALVQGFKYSTVPELNKP